MDQTEEIDYDEIMRQQAEKLMALKKGPCAKKKPLFGYREKKQFDSADYFNIQSHISNASEQTSPIGNALTSTSYIDDEETIPYTPNSQSDNKETGLENAIQLSMQLKKKVIQASSFGEQTFPMLVSLLADQSKTTSRAPIDLVCVIDHSGSMQGEKMKLVKNTFNYLLRYLKDSDRLSIVIFDNEAKRIVPLLRTTDQNKERIINSVDRIRADGGTNITLGMVHAFEILKQRRYKNPVSSIFLLSDGLDSVASRRVKASLSGYSCLDDVTIHTFGFGHDHDPQLMSDIADLRDGNFYNIKELQEVDKAFVDCLGGLLSSVAQSVEVKIQPEQSEALQGVEIVKAYGDASMWTKEGQVYNTKMLSLISGRKKGFVLEIKIPTTTKELNDNQKNVKIASVEVQIVDLANQHVTKKADLYVTLLNEDEEVKEEDEEEADKEVMTNFYRVKGAALMQEARQLAEKSKFDDAKKILESFKEELENSFLKQEVFIKNLVTDVQKAIQYTSPQVYREIGKGALMSNARAQFKERTTFDSANYFQNKVQEDMLDELEAMKTK